MCIRDRDKKVFVYGGNLGKPQGIPFVIQCLSSQAENKDVYFIIVGDGTEYGNCLLYTSMPNLSLFDGVADLIDELKTNGIKVGIISDGRPNGQQNKLTALGLDNIVDDIIITDALGGEQFRKPCDIAFRIMQRRWGIPFEQMMYVGDNLNKDFQAPKQLGMQWLSLIHI